MKKALIPFILILVVLTANAQSTHRNYEADSIAFVNAMWQTDSMDGFIYRHYHFQQQQVFNSNQYICVIEIPRGSTSRLAFVSDTLLTRVSEFANRSNALAGIKATTNPTKETPPNENTTRMPPSGYCPAGGPDSIFPTATVCQNIRCRTAM